MSTDLDWRDVQRHQGQAREEARALPREPVAPWVWAVVAVATLAWLGVLAWQTAVLPDRVPQHWSGVGGTPDRWASKTEALTFSVAMPLLFAYPTPLLARLVIAWPDGINAPNKAYWTWNGPRLRRFERLLREDLWLMAAWMIALLVAVDVQITVAAGRPGGQVDSGWMAGVTAVFVAGLLGYVAYMYARRYRDDPTLP